ncbi:MAG TPA: hypothetical protein VG735_07860 [Caulobacterales bacterium]|nr:hypothetical protein [Caulobacterales bacterium]
MREYVQVRFKPGDAKTYCYHNDGAPLHVGARVRVETRDGIKTVDVVDVGYDSPPYGTKEVLGAAEPLGRRV